MNKASYKVNICLIRKTTTKFENGDYATVLTPRFITKDISSDKIEDMEIPENAYLINIYDEENDKDGKLYVVGDYMPKDKALETFPKLTLDDKSIGIFISREGFYSEVGKEDFKLYTIISPDQIINGKVVQSQPGSQD